MSFPRISFFVFSVIWPVQALANNPVEKPLNVFAAKVNQSGLIVGREATSSDRCSLSLKLNMSEASNLDASPISVEVSYSFEGDKAQSGKFSAKEFREVKNKQQMHTIEKKVEEISLFGASSAKRLFKGIKS